MQIHNAAVTGSLIYNGVDISSITGSTSNINSLNAITASILSTTASLNSYTSSNNTNISNINSTTASLNLASGSAITRLSSIESTTGSLNTASGSAITRLGALETASGSTITRLSALEVASGSAITRLSALEVTSGSNITRISALETASGSAITRLSSLESKTGSYATTGSNTFVDGQYISQSSNPTGFTTTASLYTDGGLRVGRDAYISGTLYLNNVTVYGTQSVCYITSSQLNIASNLISVNTATPSVRFGGLAVYDSGSTGLTGSILWDSQNNHWVYSNPSGSSYSGGMFISGPRTAELGSETGTTACMLLAGQGGDHLTSSMIYHSSTVTCVPNTLVVNSNVGINCTSPNYRLHVNGCTAVDGNIRMGSGFSSGNSTDPGITVQGYSNAGMYFKNCGVGLGAGSSTKMLFLSNSGSVGIGTEDPVYGNLSIYCVDNTLLSSSVWGTSTAAGVTLAVYNGSQCENSVAGLRLITRDSGASIWNIYNVSTGPSAGALAFGNGSGGTGYEKLRIADSGIACFACTVCVGGEMVVKGNAGSYNTHYFTTGASNVAKYIQYNASGTAINQIAADAHSYFNSGCYVGIGATNPSSLLHICGAGTGVMLRLQNTSTVSGDQGPLIQFMSANQVGGQNFESGYIQSIWTSEGNAFGMRFATKGVDASQSEKMRITSEGYVAITGNQALKCVPYLQGMSFGWNRTNGQGESMINWTNAGGGSACDLVFNFRDSSTLYERLRIASNGNTSIAGDLSLTPLNSALIFTSGFARIFMGTTEAIRISSTGVACFSSNVCVGNSLVVGSTSLFGSDMFTYLNGGIFFSGGGSYNAGIFGRNGGCDLILQSGGIQRLNITSTGVACFACQICAPTLNLNSSGTGTLTLGFTGGSSQIAGRITATESPSYNSTGKIGFSVTTWGAGTDYGLTEVMAIDMRNADNKNPVIWMNPFGGKVGIGNTSPDFPLAVFGTNVAQGDASITSHFVDNSSFAAGVGGGISFGGYYASSTYANSFAYIQGIKENSTSGDYAGALKFGTRINGGSVTERMRITSAGIATFACRPSFPGATITCTYTCTYSSYTAGCWLGLFAGDNGYNGAYAFTVVEQFNLNGSAMYSMVYATVPYIHKSNSIGSTNGTSFTPLQYNQSGHADNGNIVAFRRAMYVGNTPAGNRTEFCMTMSYNSTFTATTYVLAWV